MNKCRRSHCKLRVHRAYTMTVWVWSAALRTLHFPPLYFQTNFISRSQYLFTCICEKVSALSLWHLADGIVSMHDLEGGSYFTAAPLVRIENLFFYSGYYVVVDQRTVKISSSSAYVAVLASYQHEIRFWRLRTRRNWSDILWRIDSWICTARLVTLGSPFLWNFVILGRFRIHYKSNLVVNSVSSKVSNSILNVSFEKPPGTSSPWAAVRRRIPK